MEPRNGFARLMEAMALVRLGRYAEARSRLEQGLGALPGDHDLTLALARLLAAAPEAAVRDGGAGAGVAGKDHEGSVPRPRHGPDAGLALAAAGAYEKRWKSSAT